jgi:hypothetical protein
LYSLRIFSVPVFNFLALNRKEKKGDTVTPHFLLLFIDRFLTGGGAATTKKEHISI